MDTVESCGTRAPGYPRPSGDTKCAEHAQKEVTFVCYDCNQLICGKCVTSIHNGHIMEELTDAMPSIKSKLQDSVVSMETEQVPQSERCIEITEQRLVENVKHIQDVINEIKVQGSKCKEELDDMVNVYVNICDKLGKENTERLIVCMTEHQTRIKELTKQIKFRKNMILTGSDVTVFEVQSVVQTYKHVDWPSLHTTEFSPSQVVTDHLKLALGTLTTLVAKEQSLYDQSNPTFLPPNEECSTNNIFPTTDNQSSSSSVGHQKPASEQSSKDGLSEPSTDQIISTRHPPRPLSTERYLVKPPASVNKNHTRTQHRPSIFKRRNSLDAPASIHRFLTARPSTSSDIRPLITVTSSSLRSDGASTSMSSLNKHNRVNSGKSRSQSAKSQVTATSSFNRLDSQSKVSNPPSSFETQTIDTSTSVKRDILETEAFTSHEADTLFNDEPTSQQTDLQTWYVPTAQGSEMEPNVTSTSGKPVHQPLIVSQFPSLCAITSICLTHEGQAWTCDEESRTLTLLSNAGDVIKTMTCKSNVNDISISPTTRRLWYCTWKCRVVEIDPTTETRMRRFTTDTWPRCVCVTHEEEVLVGTENKITLYSPDGHVIRTTDTEGSGVIRPTRITQCPLTGNIAFLEKTSCKSHEQDNGHVAVLDKTFAVKFRYIGVGEHPNTVGSVYFDPFDVKYDDKGFLLIGDFTSHSLDLITGTGNHIKTLLTGTGSTQAIGIHAGDIMWAAFRNGDDTSHVKILQY